MGLWYKPIPSKLLNAFCLELPFQKMNQDADPCKQTQVLTRTGNSLAEQNENAKSAPLQAQQMTKLLPKDSPEQGQAQTHDS